MKRIFLIILTSIFSFLYFNKEKKEILQFTPLQEVQINAIQMNKKIEKHPNYISALQSIKEVDRLKTEVKSGELKNLEEKLQTLSKKIEISSENRTIIEFQECLSLFIKYHLKKTLRDHPSELFSFLSYNPELYKQYLLAIHDGFYPELTYRESSKILQTAIQGEI